MILNFFWFDPQTSSTSHLQSPDCSATDFLLVATNLLTTLTVNFSLLVWKLGLDRYQYSVSVSGRYQWYRFGIGIADTAADTRTDTGRPWRLCNDSKRCLLTIRQKQEMKIHRWRYRAVSLHRNWIGASDNYNPHTRPPNVTVRPLRRRISPTYRVEFPWSRSRQLTCKATAAAFNVQFFDAITLAEFFSVQFIHYQKMR